MPGAESILPPRVDLPFDVLLLLHWFLFNLALFLFVTSKCIRNESLVKCTGITAAPLSAVGTVDCQLWAKDKSPEDWRRIVGGLNPDRDVLLFPSSEAVLATDFPWGPPPASSSTSSSCLPPEAKESKEDKEESRKDRGRRRLVVLEGSWNYAKTMASQILAYRREQQLAPLPCVVLREVTGQYWRFHHEGHSAVSTIEAIAHTAAAAGLSPAQQDDLLLLFRLQKWRVMRSVKSGGKVPKAVEVCGTGLGSWKDLTEAISAGEKEAGGTRESSIE